MRPIVHIGFHKTATTWFQEQVYPRAISHRWIGRDRARRALLDPHGLSFDADEARHLLSDPADRRPPVICEENLSGYLHNGGLHGLMAPEAARRIRQVYPDALVVIMIRAQPQMISASYVQYVRGGGTYGPRRYLFASDYLTGARRHAYKSPLFAFEHFEYDRLVAYYDGLFGRDNVLVLPYEALCRDADGFLDRFVDQAGIRLDRAAIGHTPANRSFGRMTIAIGRLLGLFTARSVVDKAYLLSIPGFYELRRLLLRLVSHYDVPTAPEKILGRRIVHHIHAHYAASNRRLARMRPLGLREFGYPLEGEVAPSPARQPAPAPIASN